VKALTDLHIHSCLSPCGSEEMTPADLVGMSLLNGQNLIALTDHNTARNCPAAAQAAAAYGIGFIPGMEVTTSEDIHAVCLFPDLGAALEFDRYLYQHLPGIPNRPEIFGEQIICDLDGNPCATEPRLLIAGSDISIMDLPNIAAKYGALCYPAHIDRESNGLLSILGAWPDDLDAAAAEVSLRGDPRHIVVGGISMTLPAGLKIIRASDAHRLQDLPAQGFAMELESADFSSLAKWLMVNLGEKH